MLPLDWRCKTARTSLHKSKKFIEADHLVIVHVDLNGGLYGLGIGAKCAVPRCPYALVGGRWVLDFLRKD